MFNTDNREYRKAIQVKSTKNQFNGKEVKRLAEDLKNNFKDANDYELILIGHVPGDLLKELKENKGQHSGVKIPYPKLFDLEAFTSHACHKIDKYLDENYATQLHWRQRENLVFSLIGELQYYSTSQREVTRQKFEIDLQYWIRTHISFTDYELRDSKNFRRLYGFDASPNLRLAISKFFNRSSRKVKRIFFKKCQNFLDVELDTKVLKVIYPKIDKICFI